MRVLVYGGSGSGKSAIAEKIASDLSENRIYLATMNVFGNEDKERVYKHRKMREHLSFKTIEKTTDVGEVLAEDFDGVVLLECMSNLVANEMFKNGKIIDEKIVENNIKNSINNISDKASHLVIVSNNIFEDGIEYDESTKNYINVLGRINAELAACFDEVFEVVAGILIRIK